MREIFSSLAFQELPTFVAFGLCVLRGGAQKVVPGKSQIEQSSLGVGDRKEPRDDDVRLSKEERGHFDGREHRAFAKKTTLPEGR